MGIALDRFGYALYTTGSSIGVLEPVLDLKVILGVDYALLFSIIDAEDMWSL